ncbi:MAG: hypothetical protein Q8M15_02315 [Bacteroidota bacterium]|nr:hypothetical protein [Bacteroidota bacterium]
MTRILFLFLTLFCGLQIYAQAPFPVEGKVSFVTQSSVYVKFGNTEPIKAGDTLYIKQSGTAHYLPCLKVNARSSTTCVANNFSGISFQAGQIVYSFQLVQPEKIKQKTVPEIGKQAAFTPDTPEKIALKKNTPQIHGRIGISNYSNFSASDNKQGHRQVGSLYMYGSNLGHSRVSAETNIIYSRVHPAAPSEYTSTQSMLRIYGLSVKYDFKKGGGIIAGRRFNDHLSSMGAIDGLQIEKSYRNLFGGIVVGYRPDLFSYALNSDLFQYGFYFGHKLNKGGYSATTALGYIEQTNKFKTDRKYAAFQHSGSFKKISLFASSELELYNPTLNKLRLSSLYVSANYELGKKSALMLSYDSRKMIVFYESYFYDLSSYLNNDIAMNGLRLRWSLQLCKNIYTSIGAAIRYQSNGANKSDNYNVSVSWNNIPLIHGNISLSGNSNLSGSIESHMGAINYSRDFFSQKIQVSIFFRFQQYEYSKWREISIFNQYYGGSINYNISKKFSMNGYYEFSAIDERNYHRISLSAIKRF